MLKISIYFTFILFYVGCVDSLTQSKIDLFRNFSHMESCRNWKPVILHIAMGHFFGTLYIHCHKKRQCSGTLYSNFDVLQLTFVIFGRNVAEKVCY